MEHQEILAGFIRLDILHHAPKGDLYGQWMIEELVHHGYKVSAGTLYPMLHSLGDAKAGPSAASTTPRPGGWKHRNLAARSFASCSGR